MFLFHCKRIPNTRIQCLDTRPLVSLTDDDDDDNNEDFHLPVYKLTQEELGEELQIFNTSSHSNASIEDLKFRQEDKTSVRSAFCCLKDLSCQIC